MKKILLILSSISISASSITTVSCSFGNQVKVSITNKINALMLGSSYAAKTAILNSEKSFDASWMDSKYKSLSLESEVGYDPINHQGNVASSKSTIKDLSKFVFGNQGKYIFTPTDTNSSANIQNNTENTIKPTSDNTKSISLIVKAVQTLLGSGFGASKASMFVYLLEDQWSKIKDNLDEILGDVSKVLDKEISGGVTTKTLITEVLTALTTDQWVISNSEVTFEEAINYYYQELSKMLAGILKLNLDENSYDIGNITKQVIQLALKDKTYFKSLNITLKTLIDHNEKGDSLLKLLVNYFKFEILTALKYATSDMQSIEEIYNYKVHDATNIYFNNLDLMAIVKTLASLFDLRTPGNENGQHLQKFFEFMFGRVDEASLMSTKKYTPSNSFILDFINGAFWGLKDGLRDLIKDKLGGILASFIGAITGSLDTFILNLGNTLKGIFFFSGKDLSNTNHYLAESLKSLSSLLGIIIGRLPPIWPVLGGQIWKLIENNSSLKFAFANAGITKAGNVPVIGNPKDDTTLVKFLFDCKESLTFAAKSLETNEKFLNSLSYNNLIIGSPWADVAKGIISPKGLKANEKTLVKLMNIIFPLIGKNESHDWQYIEDKLAYFGNSQTGEGNENIDLWIGSGTPIGNIKKLFTSTFGEILDYLNNLKKSNNAPLNSSMSYSPDWSSYSVASLPSLLESQIPKEFKDKQLSLDTIFNLIRGFITDYKIWNQGSQTPILKNIFEILDEAVKNPEGLDGLKYQKIQYSSSGKIYQLGKDIDNISNLLFGIIRTSEGTRYAPDGLFQQIGMIFGGATVDKNSDQEKMVNQNRRFSQELINSAAKYVDHLTDQENQVDEKEFQPLYINKAWEVPRLLSSDLNYHFTKLDYLLTWRYNNAKYKVSLAKKSSAPSAAWEISYLEKL
ncbi:hypothetical protein [Mesoplasma seiffertii]|uniref:hypothetical protein n=1 Tax=Mesoplasma seiffertii TaxID=28224 RepID=UPI00047C3F62|nr:hypothetical protein [Mesoplasma seiffertii]